MSHVRFLAAAALAGACLAITPSLGDVPPPGQPISDPAFHPFEGHRPDVRVPFPRISDWSTLRIRLKRTICLGRCPAYTVEIAGDGTVTYVGERHVRASGMRTSHIDPRAVRELCRAFVRAEFFWTFDKYQSRITDQPTRIVTISFDGRSKTVVDYAGQRVGLPKAVTDLEDAIDEAAGTGRWVRGEGP